MPATIAGMVTARPNPRRSIQPTTYPPIPPERVRAIVDDLFLPLVAINQDAPEGRYPN